MLDLMVAKLNLNARMHSGGRHSTIESLSFIWIGHIFVAAMGSGGVTPKAAL